MLQKSAIYIDKRAYACYNKVTPKREAGLDMIAKKRSKIDLKRAIFGCFFAVIGIFGVVVVPLINSVEVSAVPETTGEPEETVTEEPENTDDGEKTEQENGNEENNGEDPKIKNVTGDGCQKSLGAVGWLVCPTTGKIAEAVDWLYDKIEDILVIDPVSMEEGSPINQIWQYFLGVTNIVFIIFLLVVIYSQITGIGISNYGVKKALPKLIVTAVLVNLSFLICTLAVDVSNIVGNGLRDVFTSVEESVIANMPNTESSSDIDPETGDLTREAKLAYADMYSYIAGGAGVAVVGGKIAFETGAIWMLIPVVLGALVAVVSGLITIALRQAVVTLLIMISPIAIVAYILPNTEQWFRKWRQLLIKMLVFYPMFSLLFGASSLAGFAIIASAKDGFGMILGTAVQIFPLFFSWSLMKMSGTFLGTINAKMQGLAARPLAAGRAMAEAGRMSAKQKHLASGRPTTPTLRLMQFMSNQNIAREAETAENSEIVKNRALAFNAAKHYDKKGRPTKDGERAYEAQARNMEYQQIIMRDKNNMNKGLGQLNAVNRYSSVAQKARLKELDNANVLAADRLKAEQARGEKIDYENAMGFHKRMEDAVNAHFDDKHGNLVDENGVSIYKRHFDGKEAMEVAARARYKAMSEVMEGSAADVQYIAATAAHGYDTQRKIIETKMQKYFELTPPTKDVEYRLGEMTRAKNAIDNIDSIIPGLRILNQRGDTDLVRQQLEHVLDHGVDLGSHASQSLASFLMFEVKDNDPFLRRFGKYINLETAKVYNENERKRMQVSLDEYVTGKYEEDDPQHPGVKIERSSKRPMEVLMEGTSLDGMERTAMQNLDDMLKKAYTKDKRLDVRAYLDQRKKIEKAIAPQFISASLKYLSGSEQLKNMVSFLTGYDDKGRARWEKDLAGDARYAEEYFRQNSIDYLLAQTPAQLLGLRSDYQKALMKHLENEYRETKMGDWDESYIKEREEILAEEADIPNRYDDLPPEVARGKREEDLEKLRDRMIGAQFKQILDSKGKLNQIYRTRRSGAANNAKDWVRKWLDLDNEVLITMRLEEDKKKLKEEVKRERSKRNLKNVPDGDIGAGDGGSTIYDDVKRAELVSYVEDLWDSLRSEDDDGEGFYRESVEYIKKELGADSYIEAAYRHFRENNPYADGYELRDFLKDLFNDPENY